MEKQSSELLQKFKAYPSIQLSTNTKFLNRIYKSNYQDPQFLWVASEKIHGANFSIHYNCLNDSVKYARRNDFISKQISVKDKQIQEHFFENFYNAPDLVLNFHNKLETIKQSINKLLEEQKRQQKIETFHIYGEYFGGAWPGKVQCKKRVQPGVYYTPNHQFMAFDVRMCFKDFCEWVKVTDIPKILEPHIKCVPIYTKGSLQQVLKVSSQFNSTIPQLFELEKLQDNICQGLVIRPNKNLHTNSRVILKKKNKEFLQKTGGNVKSKNPKQKLDKTLATPYLQILEQYLNQNRVESAISKYPDYKDRYHLKGYVIDDIYSDALKDDYEAPTEPQVLKQVKRQFDKMVITFVTNYLNKKPDDK